MSRSAVQDAGCVEVGEDGRIDALTLGRTASFYYLKHESMRVLSEGLRDGMDVPEVSRRASFTPGCRLCAMKSRSPQSPLTGMLYM